MVLNANLDLEALDKLTAYTNVFKQCTQVDTTKSY